MCRQVTSLIKFYQHKIAHKVKHFLRHFSDFVLIGLFCTCGLYTSRNNFLHTLRSLYFILFIYFFVNRSHPAGEEPGMVSEDASDVADRGGRGGGTE